MRILLMGLGNASARFSVIPQHPENFAKDIPGYEMITFGYNEGVDIQIKPEDDFQKVVENLPHGWMPDYCLMYNLVWNLLPKGIENAPFPTVYLALDWDYHVLLSRTNAESVDLEIVGGDYAKETVKAMGANNVETFYDCGIMREFFPSSPRKIKDRRYDIFYTTILNNIDYLDRSKWILKLCELSKKYDVLIVPYSPSYQEYLALLQNSKLAFSHNRDGHMSFRVMEAASQGTVIIDTGKEIKKYFVPDKDYIPVTEEDFFEQVELYLENENVLQDMSDRFRSKVEEDFESRKHFVKLIELADKILKKKKLTRRYNSLPDDEKFVRRGEVYYFLFFRGVIDQCFIDQDKRFLDLSMEEFKKAIAIRPTPRAMTDLAIVKASLDSLTIKNSTINEKRDEAITILNEVISFCPLYAIAYFNLGLTHFRIGNKEEALSAFKMALYRFRNKDSIVDPWCLHRRELENEQGAFSIGKALDANLLLLCRGERDKAEENIRRLYEAATLYYIYLIEESSGDIYKALESLLEACNLYPDSGLLATDAAMKLALLGHKEESLNMYRKAINLLPLNIDLRIEYLKLLYLYRMDRKAINEIKDMLKITGTVTMLREKTAMLKDVTENFCRFNSSLCYSYDSGKEGLLNDWIKQLYVYLRKDPKNLKLILRIVEIWHELGRVDKIFEIVEDYIDKYLNKNISNDEMLALKDIYDYLMQATGLLEKSLEERLCRLRELISNIQRPSSIDEKNCDIINL